MNDRKIKAQEVLPKVITMIESDLMELAHNSKNSIAVAIVANSDKKELLAEYHVAIQNLSNDFTRDFRK